LTREEADRLIRHCPPHLAALVRFALATGCRASEITGLEWNRVDLDRKTAWLNKTKNGTPRGVPLNEDAIEVFEGADWEKPDALLHLTRESDSLADYQYCLAYSALAAAGIEDFQVSRPAPYVGFVASSGGNVLR
jgi:integrase